MSGCIVGPAIACRDRPSSEDLPQPHPRPQSQSQSQSHILNPESLKLESHIRWLAADSAELSFALSAGMGGGSGGLVGFIHRLLPTIYKRCNCRRLFQLSLSLSLSQVDSCCKSKKCAWETATASWLKSNIEMPQSRSAGGGDPDLQGHSTLPLPRLIAAHT